MINKKYTETQILKAFPFLMYKAYSANWQTLRGEK